MKVTLVKQEEVEFTLPEEKCEKISQKTFRMLTGYEEGVAPSAAPKMVAFKNREEFMKESYKYNLDKNSDVLINQKGNIFCYLAGEAKSNNNKSEETADVTADTEENKGE